MDVGGIMLDKGFGGVECRKMRSKGTLSTVTQTEVVFQVRGKREVKGKREGTSRRRSRRDVMASAKGAAGMSAWGNVRMGWDEMKRGTGKDEGGG